MNTPHNKNNTANIASKELIDVVFAQMPKGSVTVNSNAKRLAESGSTDWVQTGNLTIRNANGSLDTNPKSLLYSNFNLND